MQFYHQTTLECTKRLKVKVKDLTFLSCCAESLQTGGVQRRPVCTDGAPGAGDGAGKEEATHAGDQTTKL